MIGSRLGLKALVLSGLVLALMAFGTAGAQAETGSKWLVNGVDVADTLPGLVVKAIENKTAVLHFTTLGGTLVEILCTAAEFESGAKLTSNGSITLGRVVFTGCVVLLNKVLSPKCLPHSTGQANGTILTLEGEGLLVLDKLASGEVTDLVKITPETNGVLSKHFVTIEMGELCSIGESVPVETTALGEGLWIKDIGGNKGALESKVVHLIVEADAPLHKLLALNRPALILGSAEIELSSGLPWRGDWA